MKLNKPINFDNVLYSKLIIPRFIETWDYKGYLNLYTGTDNVIPYEQSDWNVTMITMLNKISAQINHAINEMPTKIVINEKLVNLFINNIMYNLFSEKFSLTIDNEISENQVLITVDGGNQTNDSCGLLIIKNFTGE